MFYLSFYLEQYALKLTRGTNLYQRLKAALYKVHYYQLHGKLIDVNLPVVVNIISGGVFFKYADDLTHNKRWKSVQAASQENKLIQPASKRLLRLNKPVEAY